MSTGSFKNIINKRFTNHIYLIYMYFGSLKGIQSDKVVLEWKETVNTFVE